MLIFKCSTSIFVQLLVAIMSTFPVVEDLTLHDSQMVSQEISIDDDDPEEHVHGELASAVLMFECYVYFMMTCLYIHVYL